jgi:prophage maintenance system killer protein
MLDQRNIGIINFLKNNGESSSREIFDSNSSEGSYATIKRSLAKLISANILETKGKGKGTKYGISPTYNLLRPIDLEEYYEQEIDERKILSSFNFHIIPDVLENRAIFSTSELELLDNYQSIFTKNVSQLSVSEFKKELERLAIDLSWKSSQIEGNTYTLLETEKLLKERETAAGRTKDEATMLLNHKDALDLVMDHPDYLESLTVAKIEDIHSVLTKELNVERNLRKKRVGISGTNYKPLDNEFQIIEALLRSCKLINEKENVFEKALLALVLISYIQPFMDGNKRTARIVSNAILINHNYCPLSFRTVDSLDYKKAMLLFYEQNNIYHFKEIFIKQYQFAVQTYF